MTAALVAIPPGFCWFLDTDAEDAEQRLFAVPLREVRGLALDTTVEPGGWVRLRLDGAVHLLSPEDWRSGVERCDQLRHVAVELDAKGEAISAKLIG